MHLIRPQPSADAGTTNAIQVSSLLLYADVSQVRVSITPDPPITPASDFSYPAGCVIFFTGNSLQCRGEDNSWSA